MSKKEKATLEARAIRACYHLLEHLEGARRQSGVLINDLRGIIQTHKQTIERRTTKGVK